MNVLGEIKTDEYLFTIEENDGDLFCHIDIFKWSSEIYKKMLLNLADIKESLSSPLWCNILKGDKKEIKIANMFGFALKYETEQTYIMELV